MSEQQKNLPNGTSKSNEDSKKKTKEPKKMNLKTKTIIQQVIDLDQEGPEARQVDPSEQFVTELAKKCNVFFTWIGNTKTSHFAEQLWKNEMMVYANTLYPELNNDELQRLVDRDWRYMSEEERQRIVETYSYLPNEQELERQIAEQGKRQLI